MAYEIRALDLMDCSVAALERGPPGDPLQSSG